MTIKITQKYLRALNLFKFYIQEFRGFIRSSTITSDQILDYVGFSNKDIKEILQHTRYITEKEFSLISEFFTSYSLHTLKATDIALSKFLHVTI